MGVQEAYLRDDILCGSPACRVCALVAPPLPENASHYLVMHTLEFGRDPPSLRHLPPPLGQIPDCDSLRSYVEILELPQVTGIIILTSVLSQASTISHLVMAGWQGGRVGGIATANLCASPYSPADLKDRRPSTATAGEVSPA